VQVRDEPVDLVPADAASAEWRIDVQVLRRPEEPDGAAFDMRGPAVHGRPGARFLYLTWGDVTASHPFTMFRRAKLMLDPVDPALVRRALAGGRPLVATIDLTDAHGGPRCGRVDAPALRWSV